MVAGREYSNPFKIYLSFNYSFLFEFEAGNEDCLRFEFKFKEDKKLKTFSNPPDCHA